jgi:hypothetical protein
MGGGQGGRQGREREVNERVREVTEESGRLAAK